MGEPPVVPDAACSGRTAAWSGRRSAEFERAVGARSGAPAGVGRRGLYDVLPATGGHRPTASASSPAVTTRAVSSGTGEAHPLAERHPRSGSHWTGLRFVRRHPSARSRHQRRPAGRGTDMTTADVSGPYAGASPSKHTGIRVAVGILGLAAVVVGVVLLFHPVAAARTLALLVGLALVVGGLLEVAVGWDSDRRAGPVILGVILVVGGLLAAFWPGITLWTLALITGL